MPKDKKPKAKSKAKAAPKQVQKQTQKQVVHVHIEQKAKSKSRTRTKQVAMTQQQSTNPLKPGSSHGFVHMRGKVNNESIMQSNPMLELKLLQLEDTTQQLNNYLRERDARPTIQHPVMTQPPQQPPPPPPRRATRDQATEPLTQTINIPAPAPRDILANITGRGRGLTAEPLFTPTHNDRLISTETITPHTLTFGEPQSKKKGIFSSIGKAISGAMKRNKTPKATFKDGGTTPSDVPRLKSSLVYDDGIEMVERSTRKVEPHGSPGLDDRLVQEEVLSSHPPATAPGYVEPKTYTANQINSELKELVKTINLRNPNKMLHTGTFTSEISKKLKEMGIGAAHTKQYTKDMHEYYKKVFHDSREISEG